MNLIKAETTGHYKAIRDLYQSAFPKCEKKPFRLMKYKQRMGMTDIWFLEKNGEFVGLAITMKARDLILLDYFAIAEDRRGKGEGAEALKELQRYYEGKRFFLEIESTKVCADNREQREKRKRFYLGNGMSEMGILADVFGTEMELLGYHCTLDFEEYLSVYREVYGKGTEKHLKRLQS